MANKIIAGILFVVVIVSVCRVALSFAPRPADVERTMATQSYKAEQAAHLAKF